MITKPYRYFSIVLLAFLGACGKQTALLTEIPIIPTDVSSPTPLPTSTLVPATDIPTPLSTPLPTQPTIPIITPDAIQVERWKEYEVALAQGILPMFSFESILCEWDILTQSSQKVYVWAACGFSKGDDSRPAVIHLDADGSVDRVEVPTRGSSSEIDKMFPEEAQVKFSLYIGDSIFDGRLREMYNHLTYRETHPEEPPLIVLSVTPLPTQPTIPIITPDAIQVEQWKEYQAELAKSLLLSPGEVLCEWDILGISEQVLYVWVICESIIPFGTTSTGNNIYSSSSTPALIRIDMDGYIHSVEIPRAGISDYQRMFPAYIQEKFESYRFGKARNLSDHIEWRRAHPDEPPLIILSVMPSANLKP